MNVPFMCGFLNFLSFFSVKPNLQIFRAKFSEITPNSIRRACETLGEPNANISNAVDVRQELDLRIGEKQSQRLKHSTGYRGFS